jgi:holo-[acyl-carrier protein] synthase
MIGCDIVEISRFKKNPDRWAEKILTDLEKEEYQKRKKSKVFYIAGRWAVKEALYKCLKTKKDYSILTAEDGSPYVLEDPNIKVTLSHERKYCIAFILIS